MADINWSGGGGAPYSLSTGGAPGFPGGGGGFGGGLDLNTILNFAMNRANRAQQMKEEAFRQDLRDRQLARERGQQQDVWASQDRANAQRAANFRPIDFGEQARNAQAEVERQKAVSLTTPLQSNDFYTPNSLRGWSPIQHGFKSPWAFTPGGSASSQPSQHFDMPGALHPATTQMLNEREDEEMANAGFMRPRDGNPGNAYYGR